MFVRPAKGSGGKFGPFADARFLAAGSKKIANLFGENSLAFDPPFEARIVQLFSAAQMTDSAEHLLLAIGKMFLQPALEQRCNCEGEPDYSVARELRASFRGSREDRGNFVVR